MTCSLGGKCINNTCICRPTWQGDNCEILNLLKSDEYKAFYRSTESSWGGSVIYSAQDQLYHMFAADMAYNCTLAQWKTNSRIVHVTSSKPNGPYSSIKNIVVPIWSHNPTIQKNPFNDEYVIYHIGWGNVTSPDDSPINCSSSMMSKHDIHDIDDLGDDPGNNSYPNRAYSKSLNNDNWTILKASSYQNYNNPQAYIYENGSILLIWSRETCINITNESICFGIAMSDGFDKPFYYIGQINNEISGEDGYFWRDINGNFHMIYHTLIDGKYGAHAYSLNGIDWYLANKNYAINPAFRLYYNLTNGTDIKLHRRERTQILLDNDGYPIYIFNGVEEYQSYKDKSQRTYTGVQPINRYN